MGVEVNGIKVAMLALKQPYLNACFLRLYANPATISGATVITDLTEATFPGYAAQATTAWTAPSLNAGNQAQMTLPQLTFTATGPSPSNQIYGWYLTHPTGGLVAVEANPSGPATINGAGQTFGVGVTWVNESYYTS
jgi:hypothetical protein